MIKYEEGMILNTNRTCESRSGRRSRVAAWYCTGRWGSRSSCFPAMDEMGIQGRSRCR